VLKEELFDLGIEVIDDARIVCKGTAVVRYVGNGQNSVAVEVDLIF
jgi:hypothetical protein